MKILRDLLHVRPVVPEHIGKIVIPESLKPSILSGYLLFDVLAVGPGRTTRRGNLVPIEAAPGDRIVVLSHTSGPIELTDGTAFISEDQVLLVVTHSKELQHA